MPDCHLSTPIKTLKFSPWEHALVMQPSCWWLLIWGRKKHQFWAWKLKQLETLQEKFIWHVACSGCSVINSLSAPGLSRKRALEVLSCCPIWYRNKWQILCCQLKLRDSLWFLRSLQAQHQYLPESLVFGITELLVQFQYVQLFGVCYLVRSCGKWKN